MEIQLHESAGGILYRKSGKEIDIFLLKHSKNGYVLPKGHREAGEDLLTTAKREIREETGYDVADVGFLIDKISYSFTKDGVENRKEVTYFGFLVDSNAYKSDMELEDGENIESGEWFPVLQARDMLSFDSDKTLVDKLLHLLHDK